MGTAYTIEFFVRTTAAHNNIVLATEGAGDDTFAELGVNYETGAVAFVLSDSLGETIIDYLATPSISVDTWYHVAVVNENDTYSLYFNGERVATGGELLTPTWGDTIPEFIISSGGTTADDLWIDEIRVSNSARYNGAAFTPPSSAFTLD